MAPGCYISDLRLRSTIVYSINVLWISGLGDSEDALVVAPDVDFTAMKIDPIATWSMQTAAFEESLIAEQGHLSTHTNQHFMLSQRCSITRSADILLGGRVDSDQVRSNEDVTLLLL